MSDDLKDILSNHDKDIDQEKLLQYLNRNLSDEEQHHLEQQMGEDDFMADALEGLEQIHDKKNLQGTVDQMNETLRRQIQKKKQRKEKRKLPSQTWTYIAVLTILLLLVIAFLLLKKL